jgi:hypothetical protein
LIDAVFVDGDEITECYSKQLIHIQIHGKSKLNNEIKIGDGEE